MLKSMRRDALCKLYSYITKPYHRTLPEESEKMTHTPVKDVQDNKKTVIAEVRTKEQYYAVNESGLTDEIYIHIEDMQFDDVRSLISLAKKPVYLVMPRIFRTDAVLTPLNAPMVNSAAVSISAPNIPFSCQ